MAKEKIEKTNALRILDSNKVSYSTHTYEAPDGFLDGVSVAAIIGIDTAFVFKTLVLQGISKNYYVCVIPVAKELDLKLAAKYFGEKSLFLIPVKDITAITGYIKGGCSPVGMKKAFKTAISSDAQTIDKITVSAGRVGLQMTLNVSDLIKVTRAEFADMTDSQ